MCTLSGCGSPPHTTTETSVMPHVLQEPPPCWSRTEEMFVWIPGTPPPTPASNYLCCNSAAPKGRPKEAKAVCEQIGKVQLL